MRAKWADGSYRARVTRNGSHSPERRARIAEAIRAKWADPDYRARALEGIRRGHNTSRATRTKTPVRPEVRAKISQAMKRKWQDADFRRRQLDAIAAPRAPGRRQSDLRAESRLVEGRATMLKVHNGVAAANKPYGERVGTSAAGETAEDVLLVDTKGETSAESPSPLNSELLGASAVTNARMGGEGAARPSEVVAASDGTSDAAGQDAERESDTAAARHEYGVEQDDSDEDAGLIAWGNTIIDFGDDLEEEDDDEDDEDDVL